VFAGRSLLGKNYRRPGRRWNCAWPARRPPTGVWGEGRPRRGSPNAFALADSRDLTVDGFPTPQRRGCWGVGEWDVSQADYVKQKGYGWSLGSRPGTRLDAVHNFAPQVGFSKKNVPPPVSRWWCRAGRWLRGVEREVRARRLPSAVVRGSDYSCYARIRERTDR